MATKREEHLKRFTCSGISCMFAAFCTNPIDVIKTRLQLDNELSGKKNIFKDRYYKGMFRGMILIVKDEGFTALYKGVTASLIREGVYSTIRLGAYEPMKEIFGASHHHSPLWKKLAAGATTGAFGSAIATPTDLVRVRMQGQKPGEKMRYRNTFYAFRRIIQQEGILGLYRGLTPTVQRATVLTAVQIASYDHIKHLLLRRRVLNEGFALHLTASFIAGFITAFAVNPMDVAKTRVMNENIAAKGNNDLIYRSASQTYKVIFRTEGIGGFYKGVIPSWLRLGPHTVITFLVFEKLRFYVGLSPI